MTISFCASNWDGALASMAASDSSFLAKLRRRLSRGAPLRNRLPLRLGSLNVDFLLCMNRRTFVQRLAALPVLSALWRFLPASTHAASTGLSTTRVRPTDPGWPTPASWEKLNRRIGGRLIKVESPLVACEGASIVQPAGKFPEHKARLISAISRGQPRSPGGSMLGPPLPAYTRSPRRPPMML